MEMSLIITGALVLAVLVLLVAIGMNIKKVYQVPKANEILVRTGGSKPAVSKGGGLVKLPWVHEIARISAEAVTISIDREGAQALRTGNYLLANVKGTMLVQVDPEKPETAAQALGSAGPSELENAVRKIADSIVDDAMRTAARKKTFDELNLEKDKIAEEVRESIGPDLDKLGIKLLAVTITDVKQQPFDENDHSVDTARGRQVEAEITQKAAEETNRIEQEAKVAIQKQNVDAREAELEQNLRKAEKEADNKRQVEEYEAKQRTDKEVAVLEQAKREADAKAENERAIAEKAAEEEQKTREAQIAAEEAIAVRQAAADAAKKKAEEEADQKKVAAEIAKNKAIETARVAKEKEVEAAKIEKEKEIEAARIAKEKEIEAAKIAKEQEIKVSDEQRHQAVEEAEVARQVAVAKKREEEAHARAAENKALAGQKQAEEEVQTVEETAQAERAAKIVKIKAIEQREKAQEKADEDAYIEVAKAEAEAKAAAQRADAEREKAKGVADALKAKTEGEAEAEKAKAQGYADSVGIRAKADADAADMQAEAKIKLAQATLKEGEAAAEARQKMVEAENKVSMIVVMRDLAAEAIRTDMVPKTVAAVMNPIGEIGKDIKILQVNGLGAGDDEVGGLPAQILNTGLAAAGVAPFLNAAAQAVVENPEVKQMTDTLAGVAKGALREAASGVREGLTGEGDNHVSAGAK